MTPKNWTDFVRIIYSGPSGERHPRDPNVARRVVMQQGDPRIDKVEFEREYTSVDFDLDARGDIGQRVQQHRIEEIERLLKLTFEAGVNEGRRQIRETLKETIGI